MDKYLKNYKKEQKQGNSNSKQRNAKSKTSQREQKSKKAKQTNAKSKTSQREQQSKKANTKAIKKINSKNTTKYNIKDIYHNIKKFGYMIEIPNEFTSYNKNFKIKCNGDKKPIIDIEPEINKKTFGFLLPQLNKSLYVSKQKKYNCYNTDENKNKNK